MPNPLKYLVTVLATIVIMLCFSASAEDEVNLFPGIGMEIQRLRFHTGRTVDHKPELFGTLPDIPGPPSHWSVSQWRLDKVLEPNHMTENDPVTRDSRLGIARYAFTAPGGRSHVWIYRDPLTENVIYDLYEQDGSLTELGGANIFLSSDAPKGGIALDQRVNYEVDLKLSEANILASEASRKHGTVLAQIFTGFVIEFPEPESALQSTIFLQIPISGSNPPSEYISCHENSGHRTIIFNGIRQSMLLPFMRDEGPLHHFNYKLDDYLCALLNRTIRCRSEIGVPTQSSRYSLKATKLHDWKITSIYIGLETQNRDVRKESVNKNSQGSVSTGVQFSNIKVEIDKKNRVEICNTTTD